MSSRDTLERWRGLALAGTMTVLMYGFISGFFLFLFGPLLGDGEVGFLHWLISLAGLIVVGPYLFSHYNRVRPYRGSLHYLAGLLSLTALFGVVATGVGMSSFIEEGTPRYARYELGHLMSGFAFVILLAVHLTLVARIGIAREGDSVVKTLWLRVVLVPALISVGITALSVFLDW